MLYLGEGDKESQSYCTSVLKLIKQKRDKNFYQKSCAIPFQPLFRTIKNHIDQIKHHYPNSEIRLLYVFIRKLIPGRIAPLNYASLSQMSLCCAHVKLQPDDLRPQPINAYVDGYYHLVIPIGGSIIRIPLIPDNSDTPVSLPPSIRFIGDDITKKAAQDFIINKAPKHGRFYQLHSFISYLSRSNPKNGPLVAFADSLTSIDLSFATAICSLAFRDSEKFLIPMLANVLGCYHHFDHFLRSLSTMSRVVVASSSPNDNCEFAALVNLFISSSINWVDDFAPVGSNITFADLIRVICTKRIIELPDLSLYVLKIALVMAAYHDSSGKTTIAMLFELAFKPFVQKYYLEAEYATTKEKLVRGNYEDQDMYSLITLTINKLLAINVEMDFTISTLQRDLEALYGFVLQNADAFVRLVISLNARPKEENPLLQTMLFVYQQCQSYNIEE